jgi:hypothetical protein
MRLRRSMGFLLCRPRTLGLARTGSPAPFRMFSGQQIKANFAFCQKRLSGRVTLQSRDIEEKGAR